MNSILYNIILYDMQSELIGKILMRSNEKASVAHSKIFAKLSFYNYTYNKKIIKIYLNFL